MYGIIIIIEDVPPPKEELTVIVRMFRAMDDVISVVKLTNECVAAPYARPDEEAARLCREWREDLVMTSLQSQPPQ